MPPADNSGRFFVVDLAATAGGAFLWIAAMIVQTVAFWNSTFEEVEPQVTVSKSDEEILHEYKQLPPPLKKLLQKSRVNLRDNGTPICYEWINGNGYLPPVVCMFRDVGPRPTQAHKIDRLDKTLPHGPGNSFWSIVGRPPQQITIAGRVLPLADVAKMAGLTSDGLVSRCRRIKVESAVLTPRSTRKAYPFDQAVAFLRSIDLYADNAVELIKTERKRWAATNRRAADRTCRSKFNAFISKPAIKNILRIMNLNLHDADKARLLGYYSAPKELKQGTQRRRAAIIDRCTNPSNESFSYYGGRGIKVDTRWIHGCEDLTATECFVIDVGFAQPGMELDRIDNDGNYERSNCRWITRTENMRNCFRAEDIAARLNAMVEAKIEELLRQAR